MSHIAPILLSLCLGVLASFAAVGSLVADPAAGAPPASASSPAIAPAAAQNSPSPFIANVPPPAVPGAPGIRELELPVETGTYRQGNGVELAQAFCLTCHSVEYCETQPPSGEKYWSATVKKMMAELAQLQSRMLEKSEHVGDRFPDEARAIHLGEAEARAIHGRASPAEAKQLADEGIPVAPLPFPVPEPDERN